MDADNLNYVPEPIVINITKYFRRCISQIKICENFFIEIGEDLFLGFFAETGK